MVAHRAFPAGQQFALTWSIPQSYGGLTSALLSRSRAFVELGGARVSVLTLDPMENRVTRDATLAARSALVPGLTVTNLYDWLREDSLPGGSLRLDRDLFTPLTHPELPSQDPAEAHADATTAASDAPMSAERDTPEGPIRRLIRRSTAGEVLQIDHFRADGTLVLTDRRDTRERGVLGGRALVLCDPSGTPVRSWRKIYHLYAAWLDRLTAREPSFLLLDSKVTARFALEYRRANVTTVHIVHGSHQDDDGLPVRDSRSEVFARLSELDAVVFLTESQRSDVQAIVGSEPHLVTIPNSIQAQHELAAESTTAATAGTRTGAVVIARLEPLKQVDQAIAAVQLANDRLDVPVSLNIYGEGELLDELRAQAADDPQITFQGFTSAVPQRLAAASILILTSRSEAFGLVIGEAMAVGCIPIVYDIDYGPSDFITDGHNGFLIPEGDVSGIAAALRHLATLSPERLAELRRAAIARAADFSPEQVTELWATELEIAHLRHEASQALIQADRHAAKSPKPARPDQKRKSFARRAIGRVKRLLS